MQIVFYFGYIQLEGLLHHARQIVSDLTIVGRVNVVIVQRGNVNDSLRAGIVVFPLDRVDDGRMQVRLAFDCNVAAKFQLAFYFDRNFGCFLFINIKC